MVMVMATLPVASDARLPRAVMDLLDGVALEYVAEPCARPVVHDEAHALAGRLVMLRATATLYHVVDWWDRCTGGRFWMDCPGSPWCLEYAVHVRQVHLPVDNEVVYVKDTHGFGRLVHVTELGEVTC
jgi:hypothetical protein